MDDIELSRMVNDIAQRCLKNDTPPGYFECLEALDTLEFHLLAPLGEQETSSPMLSQAEQLQRQLVSITQTVIDKLVRDIRTHQLSPAALRQLFCQYAQDASDTLSEGKPNYDFFDEFLSHLCRVDFEPSETRPRTQEMFYLQPTPGRIILDMLNAVPFSATDRFYDLGSGLGCVSIVVSLLTDAHAVGIEYEPTYVHYARCSAEKLGLAHVEFRNADAQEADLSDGTVFFMYTPFSGRILRKVLNHLRDIAQRRAITLCTYGPCTISVEHETWLSPLRCNSGDIHRLAIFSSIRMT